MHLPEKTMFQYLWENNKSHLKDTALIYFRRKISYDQVFKNITRAAQALYSMGIRKGDIVTVMTMHTPESVHAIYALNYIGAVANMVYLTLSENELVGLLRKTSSKLLLVLEVIASKIELIKSEIDCPVVVLSVSESMPFALKQLYRLKNAKTKHSFDSWEVFLRQGKSEPVMSKDHTSTAVIVYTSGTTGDPKGVMLSNDNFNAVASQLVASGKGYIRGETFLDNIPPFFGFGLSMLHLGLSVGIKMILWMQLTPDEIAKGFAKYKPDRYAGGPLVVEPIMRTVKGSLSNLVEFTGGGEALPLDKELAFNAFLEKHGSNAKYTTGFGMSECVSSVCAQQNYCYEPGSLGIPLPKANVKIVDPDTGDEFKYNEIGEMCFCTPGIMQGYYDNETATNDIITVDERGDRWLRTGDLGCVNENGFVYYKGRMKRIYVTAGLQGDSINKIFPQRIEEFVMTIPGVRACGTVVIPDEIRVNIPVVFVTSTENLVTGNNLEQIILDNIKKELPDHLWPRSVHVVAEMPLTATGKIDYKKLEKLAAER